MAWELEPTPTPSDQATGDYTNQTLMIDYAGTVNLSEYADVVGNKDDADITAGVQSGINMAEAFTNRLARVAGFTNIPLPSSSTDFPYLQTLVTKLAIAETYYKRGDRDKGSDPDGKMQVLKDESERLLREFFAGVVDGSGVDPTQSTEAGTFRFVPMARRCGSDEYSDGLN